MTQNTFLNKKSVFNSIYTENWRALYIYAYNMIRDRESAEDILQEIFTDFWVRMEDTDISSFKAYLYQAVRNQCAKKLKNKKLTTVELELLEQSLLLVEEEEPAELPKEQLVAEVFEKAQNILPGKCLEIFKLRFYDHMSINDIASLKDISASTVENQINKALKLLRKENIGYLTFAVLIACTN
ncbi:RNA polymerase sigma factor [Flavobacterium sp. RHBU_3]|uniref:RNA polymerase sigma factor n=1 Tax=Flavobacterium sp. RHBU_3 TaxID=3391184 RepID=UPI003984B999